jgi:hypothetical protein
VGAAHSEAPYPSCRAKCGNRKSLWFHRDESPLIVRSTSARQWVAFCPMRRWT